MRLILRTEAAVQFASSLVLQAFKDFKTNITEMFLFIYQNSSVLNL